MQILLPAVALLLFPVPAWAEGDPAPPVGLHPDGPPPVLAFLQGSRGKGQEKPYPTDHIGFRYRRWKADLNGDARADDAGFTGTEIDVESILGIDQGLGIDNFSVWLGVPGSARLYLDYWEADFTGEHLLAQDITFSGTTFLAGSLVDTSLEWKSITALIELDLLIPFGDTPLGLRLSPGIGGRLMSLNGILESSGVEASAELKGPLPVLSGSAELYFAKFASVEMRLEGFGINDFQGFRGKYWDLTLALRGGYAGAFAGLGYRMFTIKIEDERADVDEIEIELGIDGLFVEVGFRF